MYFPNYFTILLLPNPAPAVTRVRWFETASNIHRQVVSEPADFTSRMSTSRRKCNMACELEPQAISPERLLTRAGQRLALSKSQSPHLWEGWTRLGLSSASLGSHWDVSSGERGGASDLLWIIVKTLKFANDLHIYFPAWSPSDGSLSRLHSSNALFRRRAKGSYGDSRWEFCIT